MVKFVAHVATDSSNLADLGLLGTFSDSLKVPNTIVTEDIFDAVEKGGPAKLHIAGEAMTIVGAMPIEGVVNEIEVKHTDTHERQYELTNLSIWFGSIRASFSGSFAPTLFANDDRILGSGDDDVLYAFGGDDKIIGGKGTDAIFGGSGDDTLAGGGSDDSVSGQGGDDVIDGEKGNDTLLGGAGENRFVFDTALNATTNVDMVGDFKVGSDGFELSKSIFDRIGGIGRISENKFVVASDASDAKDLIIYDETTGNLYYDEDGSGPGGKVLFAIVTGAPSLTYKDFDVIG